VQNGGQFLLLLLLIVFTVWVFSRGRRQQRELRLTQSRLQPGAEVMTTSGLYGRVIDMSADAVVRLETSPGVVSRWDRRAVARIISMPDTEPGLEAEPAAIEPPVQGTEARPVDAIEGEPRRYVEPVESAPPAAPQVGDTPAELGRPASESPRSVRSPKDDAPPDRG
jgi:preprotein translocase subunit YajC